MLSPAAMLNAKEAGKVPSACARGSLLGGLALGPPFTLGQGQGEEASRPAEGGAEAGSSLTGRASAVSGMGDSGWGSVTGRGDGVNGGQGLAVQGQAAQGTSVFIHSLEQSWAGLGCA